MSEETNFTEFETRYFFTKLNNTGMHQCILCGTTVSSKKRYNVRRHYFNYHESSYGRCTEEERLQIIAELKPRYIITEYVDDKDKSLLRASFVVSYNLAKAQKPLQDGEFIKTTIIDVLNSFGNEGQEMSKLVAEVPLSRRTMTRRVNAISGQLKETLIDKILECEYYSLAVDDSTYINDVAQVVIFIKFIDSDFNVAEDLLNIVPFDTEMDIFRAIEISVQEIGGFDKLCGICMSGESTSDLKTQFQLRKIDVPFYQCLVDQEKLCAQSLQLDETMEIVMKIINKLRAPYNALNRRKCQSLFSELKAQYGDLKLLSEIRWLSRGKCLEKFFSLRNEIKLFLNSEQLIAKLEDIKFLSDIAFLADLTLFLNTFNMQLQVPKQSVVATLSTIDGFKKKLAILQNDLTNNALHNFNFCGTLFTEHPSTVNFACYAETMQQLRNQLEKHFHDFDNYKKLINIFLSPKDIDISKQDPIYQLELCDLQSDCQLLVVKESGSAFWRKVPVEKYPILKNSMLKLESSFSSGYVRETAFSHIKHIKNFMRNKLTDMNLLDLLRTYISTEKVDFEKLIADCKGEKLITDSKSENLIIDCKVENV